MGILKSLKVWVCSIIFFLFYLSVMASETATIWSLESQRDSNLKLAKSEAVESLPLSTFTAYPDFFPMQYLVLSLGGSHEGALKVKFEIIKNLPQKIRLIAFTDRQDQISKIQLQLAEILPLDRFRLLFLPNIGPDPTWARDSWPIPFSQNHSQNFKLIGARYFQLFEPEQALQNFTSTPILNHDYFFEGGNFVANSKGECFVVNNKVTQEIPDALFERTYGCRHLYRLPHSRGIGHADEVLRFVNDSTLITDEQELAPQLIKWGFRVHILPRPQKAMQTYVNVLQLNKTIYLPVFNQSTDVDAIQIYKNLGYHVKTINSEWLIGDGLLHCLTMTYPKGIWDSLF